MQHADKNAPASKVTVKVTHAHENNSKAHTRTREYTQHFINVGSYLLVAEHAENSAASVKDNSEGLARGADANIHEVLCALLVDNGDAVNLIGACIYVCMYIYIYIYIYTHTHKHTQTHIEVHMVLMPTSLKYSVTFLIMVGMCATLVCC
jgi:hypothetical protein